jgi:hypothetical protein
MSLKRVFLHIDSRNCRCSIVFGIIIIGGQEVSMIKLLNVENHVIKDKILPFIT